VEAVELSGWGLTREKMPSGQASELSEMGSRETRSRGLGSGGSLAGVARRGGARRALLGRVGAGRWWLRRESKRRGTGSVSPKRSVPYPPLGPPHRRKCIQRERGPIGGLPRGAARRRKIVAPAGQEPGLHRLTASVGSPARAGAAARVVAPARGKGRIHCVGLLGHPRPGARAQSTAGPQTSASGALRTRALPGPA